MGKDHKNQVREIELALIIVLLLIIIFGDDIDFKNFIQKYMNNNNNKNSNNNNDNKDNNNNSNFRW